MLLGALAGALVDLGSDSSQESIVRAGLEILEQKRGELIELIGESHLEDNLGNAKTSLYHIEYLTERTYGLEREEIL